jgi:hypothetical protein
MHMHKAKTLKVSARTIGTSRLPFSIGYFQIAKEGGV